MLVVFAALAGCRSEHAPKIVPADGPVILIVVDTLRADHLSCQGYSRPTSPAICALAEDGVRFDHAFATRPSTTPSIASMFTGLYPHRHGVRRLYLLLPDSAETVAEHFASHSWETGGFVSSFVMVNDFSGFAQGFSVYDDRVRNREPYRENYERPAQETVDLALQWLDGRRGDGRYFLFLHLIEPHGPYLPPEPFLGRFALPPGGGEVPIPLVPVYQRQPGLGSRHEYAGRYDGEIATSDHEIERFLNELRARHLYDDATIVVTSDHGESLGEDGFWFEHGRSVDEAESHVPLVVKFGRRLATDALRGRVVDDPVSGVDVFSTLLTAAGIEVPVGASGHDLRAVAVGGRRPGPPPMTELAEYGPDGKIQHLTIAGHGPGCLVKWTGTASMLSQAGAVNEACRSGVVRPMEPLIRDLAAFRAPAPLVDRSDIAVPGMRDRFVQERGFDPGPLSDGERAALRSLGYLD